MAQTQSDNHDVSTGQTPKEAPPSTGKKRSRALWIIILVFIIFVAIVFLTEYRESIAWIEDYHTGIELAKQQNKPVLLAFYKQFTPMSTDTLRHTYTNRKVIEYVEANFIPIIINVDEQPKIANRYHINYYPTHYIKRPDSDELFGPMLGYDPPALFITKLKDLLKKMNARDK